MEIVDHERFFVSPFLGLATVQPGATHIKVNFPQRGDHRGRGAGAAEEVPQDHGEESRQLVGLECVRVEQVAGGGAATIATVPSETESGRWAVTAPATVQSFGATCVHSGGDFASRALWCNDHEHGRVERGSPRFTKSSESAETAAEYCESAVEFDETDEYSFGTGDAAAATSERCDE